MDAKVTGYGPKSKIFPCIPRFLIVESHGSNHRLNERGEVGSVGLDEEIEAILYSVDLQHNRWCAVEQNRTLTWFDKDNKKKWVTDRANALVRNARIHSNPLQSIHMLEAAAQMCGFELTEFLAKLESFRERPGETLEDIFKRIDVKFPGED
jgi:hypothetical protein